MKKIWKFEDRMGARSSRRHSATSRRASAPVEAFVSLPVQQPFRLQDLRHVRLAARRANNPFFATVLVHEPYARVVFNGRGLLFTAYWRVPRPGWRVHLAFFTPLQDAAWFTLLPHSGMHASAAEACRQAEDLAARMHTGTWQQALGLFASRPHTRTP
ncbi:hypothetical protein ACWGJX_45905 [Streptomyces sp. NPDC054775]